MFANLERERERKFLHQSVGDFRRAAGQLGRSNRALTDTTETPLLHKGSLSLIPIILAT